MLFMLVALLATQTATFDVPGLTCPTCVAPVKKALALTKGVSKIDIQWEARKVVVTYEGTDEATLRAALTKAGFGATPKGQEVKADAVADLKPVEATETPQMLAVAGKVTVVLVGMDGCAPCDNFKKELAVVGGRVPRLAVRVVDGLRGKGKGYLPANADVPYVYVYDLEGKEGLKGAVGDGKAVYAAIEKALGVKAGVKTGG